jgi:hypothetical protein
MKILLPLLFSLFILPLSLVAQDKAPSASHLAEAEKVLDLLNIQETLDKGIDATLAAQLAQMPQMKNLEGTMREFFAKYMNYEVLRDDYAQLYAKYYTEKELKQLYKFYQTPLGKKVAETMPDISAASTTIGQNAVQPHMAELQQTIMKKMSEGANN